VAANDQTRKLNDRIGCEPTGYDIERVADSASAHDEPEQVRPVVSDGVDEMIAALVQKHGWGYRRVHAFLSVGGYDVPSLSTVKRRVAAVRGVACVPVESE
jgi:hypothetical protein